MGEVILQGHVIDQLATLPDESVQCVVTSPPYWGLRDYGTEPVDWPEMSYSPMPGLPPLVTVPAGAYSLGMEPTIDAYVGHLVQVWREVRRVLRADGVCFLNLGDSYASTTSGYGARGGSYESERPGWESKPTKVQIPPGLKPKDMCLIPYRVALALQADGWWVRSIINWHKPNPMPGSQRDRPTTDFEPVFLLAKSARYYWDSDAVSEEAGGLTTGGFSSKTHSARRATIGGGDPSDVKGKSWSSRTIRTTWTIATQPLANEAHFAAFPPRLVQRCILAGTSEKGCCPACGAPWVRVVERKAEKYNEQEAQRQQRRCEGAISGGTAKVTLGVTNHVKTTTTGWSPSCTCPDAEPVPCTVLDPFAGAGTVPMVATALGRKWVGIELNPKYVDIIKRRPSGPLFAGVIE